MPTTRPRLMLNLSDELHESLRDLADATEKPMARVVFELLMEMQPAMGDLARLARMTKQGKRRAALQQLARMNAAAVEEGQELQRTLPLARPRRPTAPKPPKPKRGRSG